MFLRSHQKYYCALDNRIKNDSSLQSSLREVSDHTCPSFPLPSFLSLFLSDLRTDFTSLLLHYLFLCTHIHACTYTLEPMVCTRQQSGRLLRTQAAHQIITGPTEFSSLQLILECIKSWEYKLNKC